jgi:hypothetical protein
VTKLDEVLEEKELRRRHQERVDRARGVYGTGASDKLAAGDD